MSEAQRFWSTLELKAVDEDAGIIRGVASSLSTDLEGDVIDPEGAEFNLPIPLLEQHRKDRPVGSVTAVEIKDGQILVEAQIAINSGLLYVDKVWKQVKAGLVRGLSVGIKPLRAKPLSGGTGIHYTKWRWLELSAVTIPANMEANIMAIKSLDENPDQLDELLTESGDDSTDPEVSKKALAAKQRSAKAIIGAKRAVRNFNLRK